ncbi:MAG: hypothetical protein ACHQVS_02505 [Candidatus Babeliales bacterium]
MNRCSIALIIGVVVVSLHGAEGPIKEQEPKKEHPTHSAKGRYTFAQKSAKRVAEEKKKKEEKDKKPDSPSKTPSEAPKSEDGGRPEMYASGKWRMS